MRFKKGEVELEIGRWKTSGHLHFSNVIYTLKNLFFSKLFYAKDGFDQECSVSIKEKFIRPP